MGNAYIDESYGFQFMTVLTYCVLSDSYRLSNSYLMASKSNIKLHVFVLWKEAYYLFIIFISCFYCLQQPTQMLHGSLKESLAIQSPQPLTFLWKVICSCWRGEWSATPFFMEDHACRDSALLLFMSCLVGVLKLQLLHQRTVQTWASEKQSSLYV